MRSIYIFRMPVLFFFLAAWMPVVLFAQINLSKQTTIVTAVGNLSNGEKAAARILTEEVEKRTGFAWKQRNEVPETGDVIMLLNQSNPSAVAQAKKYIRAAAYFQTGIFLHRCLPAR